jgi:glycosyltransferase involved in cell wall biosynthesis
MPNNVSSSYKILYHHRIASKDGQYVHVEEIVNALTAQGHEIIMVAPRVAENSEFGSEGGWVSKLKQKLPQALYEFIEFCYAFYDFFKLCHAIYKHKPDFIYERYNLFLPSGIWAKKLFKLPLILEVNAPIYQERKKYHGISLDAVANWTQSYCWRKADKCLPVTDVLADYLRAVGVPEQNIQVIHNGINEAAFSKPIVKPVQLPDLTNKTVIGFVGFCREWHGLDKVIDMMAELNDPSLYFLIIGDGPVLPELKAQAARLGLSEQIFMSGLVNREQMPHWVAQIDIALQPDVVPYASPLKMLEYMYMGKAIIAPRSRNIEELVTDGESALLFELEQPSSFIDQLKLVTTQPHLVEVLCANVVNEIKSKKLYWTENSKKIVNIFEKLQGKNK